MGNSIMTKVFSVVLCVFLLFTSINTFAAFDFISEKYESEQQYVIEAEDFTGSGFKVVSDPTASGGKCIVGSGDDSKTMEYTIKLENDVEKFIIYGIHSSTGLSHALSYISVNDKESDSLYDYKYNQWNQTRIFYGDVKAGDYTIKLKSIRAGQKIDKIIVKFNEIISDEETDSASSAETAEIDKTSAKYRPGRPELENEEIAVMEEQVPGGFMAEAESGTYSTKDSVVIKDKDASGGAYWMSTLTSKLMNGAEEATQLKFKFYVTKPGSYYPYIRKRVPVSEHKDFYVSFDNQYWEATSGGTPSDFYKWESVQNSAILDVGWHTFEVKHRTNGAYLDNIILLKDSNKASISGYGSLPGQPLRPDEKSVAFANEMKRNPKIKSDNYRIMPDADFEFVGDDIMIPSSSIAAALGIQEDIYDDYVVLQRDRQYLKVTAGTDRIITNGKTFKAKKATYLHPEEDDIYIISLKAAQKAFGFDYDYNEEENILNIYDFYTEPYVREASDGEIEWEIGNKTLFITVPCDDPSTKIEAWVQPINNEYNSLDLQNVDVLNRLDGDGTYKCSGYTGSASSWIRTQTPTYYDGAFHIAQYSQNDKKFIIKVKLTKNGKQDVFQTRTTKYLDGWDAAISPEEYKYDTNNELYLVPTFNNISYYIDTDTDSGDCEITYRKVGDEEWTDVGFPSWDFAQKQFRGTVPFVDEDTEYEVRAVIRDNDGKVVQDDTKTVKTWTDNPPIAQTVKLSDLYSGSGDLSIVNLKGTEDGWIKIDGEGQTVDAGKLTYAAVNIDNCEYVIFENVKVRGGTDEGIFITQRCNNMRIINCDIAEWGRGAILKKHDGWGLYYRSNINTNLRAGIMAVKSVNFVVERTYIHDSDTHTNAWTNYEYRSRHPAGCTAIDMWGIRGTVIRYNTFMGSDEHRFNDVLEGVQNGGRGNGNSCGSDSDIYGNLLIYSNDDCMELDGGQMNVRIYQNRMEQNYCGISTAPNTMGPSYIYRNLIVRPGDEAGYIGTTMKAGGSSDLFTMTYWFNNTLEGTSVFNNVNYGGSTEWHGVTRNNIIASKNFETGKYGISNALVNKYANERDDYDYDLIRGKTNYVDGSEPNGIFVDPEYKDMENGDYHLVENGPGWQAGQHIGGFTATENPNIGAFVGDKNDYNFIPGIPVDLSADTYSVFVKKGETKTVKIYVGDVETGRTYSFVKNRDYKFLRIDNEKTEGIELKPNSTVELTFTALEEGKGTILMRLDNGFAFPVIIYCE